jgi:hypothetical protein
MAYIAYRDVDSRISPPNKVKAILLYMWKAVNDNDKAMRLVNSNRSNTLSQFAGSLNIFGSGAFSDIFLSNWLKDNFTDYASFIHDDHGSASGAMVRKKLSYLLFLNIVSLDVQVCRSRLSSIGAVDQGQYSFEIFCCE